MTREPFEWELDGNSKYFTHTRNNGDNYFVPESWDIAPNTPKRLVDSFNETMKRAQIWKKFGYDI